MQNAAPDSPRLRPALVGLAPALLAAATPAAASFDARRDDAIGFVALELAF